MPLMIIREKELLRISPIDSRNLEYSNNNGTSWRLRYIGSKYFIGYFVDITDNGFELLAQTSRGFFCSYNDGSIWIRSQLPASLVDEII